MIEFDLSETTRRNYQRALEALNAARVPYVVGGAYAVFHYTNTFRRARDLDIFVVPGNVDEALNALAAAGFATWIEADYWLAKAQRDADVIDVISGFGNWLAPVDDGWITRAEDGLLFHVPVRFAPVDDMIWSKAYVAARTRFDGADIVHLINAASDRIDWDHLRKRFNQNYELLFGCLLLYRYVYPTERDKVPAAIIQQLGETLRQHQAQPAPTERICRGTLLDSTHFNIDIQEFGFTDPREQLAEARGYSRSDVARSRAWVQREQAAQ